MSDDKKEIAEKAKTAVAEMDVSMFEADAGAGMLMDQEDLALPFLKVLSAMDPGLQSGEIEAKAGDIYNTVTGAVYPGKEGVQEFLVRINAGLSSGHHAAKGQVRRLICTHRRMTARKRSATQTITKTM